MNDCDQYLRVCEPLPNESDWIEGWRDAVRRVSQLMLEASECSPCEVAEFLTRITADGRIRSDAFGKRVVASIARALPDCAERQHLVGCVCAMSAAIRVLNNRRLSAATKVSRRDSIAVALWSALAYQNPLAQPRLEGRAVRNAYQRAPRRGGTSTAILGPADAYKQRSSGPAN